MKVLAFAGSNSSTSINKMLVTHAAQVFKTEFEPNAEVEVLDLNDYEMPIYSSDRQKQSGVLDLAKQFFEKIGTADALLISFAEHNGNFSAAYKNIFDWASRIDAKVFQNKPMVLMSTSPGAAGGASVLKLALESAPHFAANVKGSFSVPKFGESFDSDNLVLRDENTAQMMRKALQALSD